MISLSHVTLAHRGLPLLNNVSLEVEPGDIVILSGESGSGKTSFLRMLYGDLPLASGRLSVDGIEMAPGSRKRIPELRRRLGIVFQDDMLLEDRSVYENIRFALSIQLKSSQEITRRALEIIAELGLSHLRSHFPSQLSSGEAQRIGIARALANDPKIILADEPTGDLDASTASEIFRYLASRYASDKIYIITTHDPSPAFESLPYARFWQLHQGEIHEAPNPQR